MKKEHLAPPLLRSRQRSLLTCLLVFACICGLMPGMAETHAQGRISLDVRNTTELKDVFADIQKQCSLRFLYSYDDVKHLQVRDMHVSGLSVEGALDLLLKGTGLVYDIDEDIIFVKKAPALPQQEWVVLKGEVKNVDGEVLPGVTVLIKGTTVGTTTDHEGRYQLKVAGGRQMKLVFSFIGMKEAEVEVKDGRQVYDVVLHQQNTELDDVVVTGFFNKNRNSFTGSVKTLKAEDIKSVSNTNLISALSMLTPGLKIMEDNQSGSNPNHLPEIVIRGTSSLASETDINPNQPVIILDGIEIGIRDLYDLDINEIERVDVLKDASASALYGEKAANGVIVIERKKILHDKLRLSYNLDGSVDFPDLNTYNYLNAADKLEFERLAGLYDFEKKRDLEDYNRKKLAVSKGLDTDWISKALRTGHSLGNSIGISGKGNNMTYRVNANFRNVKGVMEDDYRNSYGVSMFLAYHIANKLTVSYQSSYTGMKSKNSPYGTFQDYVTLNPYDSPYDEMGRLKKKLSWEVNNPLYEATCGNYDKTDGHTFTNTVNLRWDILDGLYMTANGSVMTGQSEHEVYTSPMSVAYMQEEDLQYKGELVQERTRKLDLSGNFVISYNRKIAGDNLLTFNIGGDIYKEDVKDSRYAASGFLKPGLHSPQYASAYPRNGKPAGSQNLTVRAGFFGYLNFITRNRYFVEGTVRRSGSSQFGADNRYTPFWSVGAGWNLHNENFLKRDWMNTFRIRYSYGVTGNVSFPSYQAITTYTYNKDNYYLHGIGAVPIKMGNDDLTWQSTRTHNVGLNLDLFDMRFSLVLDYYIKTTDDLLIDQTIPPSVGESTVKNNLGKQRNRGLEFDLSATLVQTKDWRFNIKLNGAHNKNRILAISNALKAANEKANRNSTGKPKTLYREGESTSAIYAVRSAGINPATGKEVFINRNGEYTMTYDTEDKVVLGDEVPKLEGAVFPMLSYRNWSLNISMSYRFGGQIYNLTRAMNVENVDPRLNVDERAFGQRWKNVNDLSPYLDIADTDSRVYSQSGRFVEDDNSLEMKRIELSYEFKNRWLKKAGFKRLRLAAGVNDVFRLSTVKYERGTDYPFSRGFSFTISPTF